MIARRSFAQAVGLATVSPMVATFPTSATGQISGLPLRVGPERTIKTLAAAARIAPAGSSIEVDAGEYRADVTVWERDALSLRASGGRVRLLADGAAAESKGIWVIRANNMVIEGFDFEGAAVPGRNGAGIRLERGSLSVRDCRFMHNEMGLLTGNDPATRLHVANCEFAFNMRPDGHNHNLYCGTIGQLSVTGSYFHHARVGHLLKSRAALNHIVCNRLTDETGGTASYELEFPNGGIAYVLGNIVEQTMQTGNPNLISVGAEGYRWTRNELYLAYNTLVTPPLEGSRLLRVMPGATQVHAINNLTVGAELADPSLQGMYRNNFVVDPSEFANSADHDYRLRKSSRALNRAVGPGHANGVSLAPGSEYLHPRRTAPLHGPAHNPGAMQSLAPSA